MTAIHYKQKMEGSIGSNERDKLGWLAAVRTGQRCIAVGSTQYVVVHAILKKQRRLYWKEHILL